MAKRFTFTGLTDTTEDIQTATALSFQTDPYSSESSTPFAITVIEFPAAGSGSTIIDYGSVYTDKWSRIYDETDPLYNIQVTSVEADGETFVVSTPLERDMPVHLSADLQVAGLTPILGATLAEGRTGEGPFMSQTFFVKPLDGSGVRVQLKTTPWNDASGIVLSTTAITSYDSETINFKLIPGHTNRIGVSNAKSIANITAGAFKTFLQDKYKASNVKKITATIELQGEPEY